jgi:uncharacterized protein YjbJ (UPF0337 family)
MLTAAAWARRNRFDARQLCAAASRHPGEMGIQYPASGSSSCPINIRSNEHMNQDQIKGTEKQVVGTVKDAAGKVLRKPGLQVEGKIENAAGKVQVAAGDVRETLKKSVDSPR